MIVLHNSLDKKSRNFVENYTTETDTILDWYKGGRDLWIEGGNTLVGVQSFPAVVVNVPAHNYEQAKPPNAYNKTATNNIVVEAHQKPICNITTKQDVLDAVDDINDLIRLHNTQKSDNVSVIVVS